jgi:hypothetical protein
MPNTQRREIAWEFLAIRLPNLFHYSLDESLTQKLESNRNRLEPRWVTSSIVRVEGHNRGTLKENESGAFGLMSGGAPYQETKW